MKTYSAASSVKRAQIKALEKTGLTKEQATEEFNKEFEIKKNEEGQFYAYRIQKPRDCKEQEACKDLDFSEGNSRREMTYTESGDPISKEDAALLEEFGIIKCPHCEIPLSNGVSCYDTQKEIAKQNKAPEAAISHQWLCLACGEEFGDRIKSSAKNGTSSGNSYENKSSAKKPCAIVWEIAIKMNEEARKQSIAAPKRKEVIEACVKAGVAYNTARTQYQSWFKASKA